MFSHVTIGISDFERALAFYGLLTEVLGYPLKFREIGTKDRTGVKSSRTVQRVPTTIGSQSGC